MAAKKASATLYFAQVILSNKQNNINMFHKSPPAPASIIGGKANNRAVSAFFAAI